MRLQSQQWKYESNTLSLFKVNNKDNKSMVDFEKINNGWEFTYNDVWMLKLWRHVSCYRYQQNVKNWSKLWYYNPNYPPPPPPPPPPLKQTTFSAENINLNNNCDFLACEIVLQAKISISVTVYHFNKEWPIKFTTAFTIKNPRCISNYITSLF